MKLWLDVIHISMDVHTCIYVHTCVPDTRLQKRVPDALTGAGGCVSHYISVEDRERSSSEPSHPSSPGVML